MGFLICNFSLTVIFTIAASQIYTAILSFSTTNKNCQNGEDKIPELAFAFVKRPLSDLFFDVISNFDRFNTIYGGHRECAGLALFCFVAIGQLSLHFYSLSFPFPFSLPPSR